MLVYRPDESLNVFYTKPINLGTSDRYGLDLNFTYDPLSWLKFMGSLDLFGYKTTGIAYYDAVDINKNPIVGTMDFTGSGFSTRAGAEYNLQTGQNTKCTVTGTIQRCTKNS